MHYYPEDQSEENLKKIRLNNVCAECGRQLNLFLDKGTKIGEKGRIYVACSGGVHEGIAREYQPPVEDYRSNIRKEVELEEKHGRETSRALATIPKQGQLTQSQAMTILKLQYPGIPDNDIVKTAIFCKDFGLHPLANEVFIIPFKKKWKDNSNKWHEETRHSMVVGIPASRKMAHALKGDFSFLDDTPRAATEEEIIKQYGKDSDEAKDNIISVTKLEGVGGNKAIGFGLYPKSESPYGMDKGNTRRNMANIRSERQGIDRLPGGVMPQVEVLDAKYTVIPEVGKVDTATGEVVEEPAIEGEATEIPPEEQTEAEAQPEPEPEPEQPKSIVDLEWP